MRGGQRTEANGEGVALLDEEGQDSWQNPGFEWQSDSEHPILSLFCLIFGTQYVPRPEQRPFLERVQVQRKGDVKVKVAALGSRESRRFFGVPLASYRIQPVWVEVDNRDRENAVILDRVGIDPNYYSPREAALKCHFLRLKRLAGLGVLFWIIFHPLLLLLPIKLLAAGRANRRVDDFFCGHAFPLGPIGPGTIARGFVFTSFDNGTKVVSVDLLGAVTVQKFVFSLPVPGIVVDHEARPPLFEELYPNMSPVDCDRLALLDRLRNEPRATTNRDGSWEGDPANLVVVGDFSTVISTFGARWDETESLTLSACLKTAKAFVFGTEYRYSPVSPLYLYGRSQDFALQRARSTVNERLHLRLWLTPMRFEGKPVWVGQISRDIGVRFAWTWNLTTHRIDPEVDEARDYIVQDLLQLGHLDRVAYIDGVGVSKADDPRRNLTGDPYVTDGRRVVIALSPMKKTDPILVDWWRPCSSSTLNIPTNGAFC